MKIANAVIAKRKSMSISVSPAGIILTSVNLFLNLKGIRSAQNVIQKILIRKKRVRMDNCHICEKELHNFLTTPILELDDGTQVQCCEECADREFPGWDEED